MDQNSYLETIKSHLQQMQEEGLVSRGLSFDEETILYGKQGVLSSLSLVTLLVDLEEHFSEKAGQPVTLAHEKAFSAGNSPLRTVGSLAAYIRKTIEAHVA